MFLLSSFCITGLALRIQFLQMTAFGAHGRIHDAVDGCGLARSEDVGESGCEALPIGQLFPLIQHFQNFAGRFSRNALMPS